VLLAPEDPVPEPTDTEAAGLVGVFALEEPVDPAPLVSVLELPTESALEPGVLVLLPSELPVAGVEDVLPPPTVGVGAPAGVLVELPVSLVPGPPGAPVGGVGPPLDSVLAEAGTRGRAVVLVTLAAGVPDGTGRTFLIAGRGVVVGVAGWLAAEALVTTGA
jgi:hypothetical protein